MHKDVKKIAKAAAKAGYDVRINKKGHIVISRDGERITTFSSTPSDRRSLNNSLAPLRRDGFQWPPRR